MITKVNNQQQPAFTAKLNIQNIRMNKTKLAEIRNHFESMTQHYTDDVLDITGNFIKREKMSPLKNANFALNGKDIGFMSSISDFHSFCRTHTPKEIAKSFTRVLKQGKLNEKTDQKLAKINAKLKGMNLAFFHANRRPNTQLTTRMEAIQSERLNSLKQQKIDIVNKHNANSQKIWQNDSLEIYFD